jgi:hypothetical protein
METRCVGDEEEPKAVLEVAEKEEEMKSSQVEVMENKGLDSTILLLEE